MAVRDPRDLPAFRAWFGGSKVVDEQGLPLVMYHGTRKEFSEFAGRPMFFFSASPEFANVFACEDGSYAGGLVMPVYISAQNPFDFRIEHHVQRLAGSLDLLPGRRRFVEGEIRRGDWRVLESLDHAIKRLGHDGIWMKETSFTMVGAINIAVFRSEQIKSAIGNRGAYDRGDVSILASRPVQRHREGFNGCS